jgi:hypothetical protein
MDYNSEQFSFDFSPQPPLPARSTHTSPASTNTQPSPPIRNRRRQHIIVIDPIRLSNQGDISNSYSGDVIDNGKIRRPFSYNGKLYVTTSSAHGPSLCKAEAYQLLPEYLFNSEPTTYAKQNTLRRWRNRPPRSQWLLPRDLCQTSGQNCRINRSALNICSAPNSRN